MPMLQVRQAVEAFLREVWQPTVLSFENDSFQQQNDDAGLLIPYVYVEVTGGVYEQRTLGASTPRENYWTTRGQLWLHIVVATGTGYQLAAQWADDLAELFRALELEPGIQFQDIVVASGGGASDGSDFVLSVSIDWEQG